MTSVMILTPPSDDDRVRGRKGDAFDIAFLEVLRTLDGQGDNIPVLAPWSPDLAPLVAAALIDSAPNFDPEDRIRRGRTVAYRPLLFDARRRRIDRRYCGPRRRFLAGNPPVACAGSTYLDEGGHGHRIANPRHRPRIAECSRRCRSRTYGQAYQSLLFRNSGRP